MQLGSKTVDRCRNRVPPFRNPNSKGRRKQAVRFHDGVVVEMPGSSLIVTIVKQNAYKKFEIHLVLG